MRSTPGLLPPVYTVTPTRLPDFRTAERLNIGLLSLMFFPDAGGAGRQTQTRPDQTFGERSGGRCGVSVQPLLASPSKQKGMKAGARLCLCGSCRAPLICSDDVY